MSLEARHPILHGCLPFFASDFSSARENCNPMSKEQRRLALNVASTNRRRRRTDEEKARERARRKKTAAFRWVAIKRWKENNRLRQLRKKLENNVKMRAARKCLFCRAAAHDIRTCDAPGKEVFMKTKWKGRCPRKERPKGQKSEKKETRIPGCAVCGDPGHNVRTCTDPAAEEWRYDIRCSNCWETGHSALTCPRKGEEQLSESLPRQ